MCAGKVRTLRATIVTIFSHMTIDISLLSYVTGFLDFFLNYHKFKLLKFRKVAQQRAESKMGSIIWVFLKISSFQLWNI